ncbi:ferredoxin-dependent glutamate synthase [Syntrophotalea carbinolica DSM 2380]|uniref:Ferredoxin-dependent glutamate synthase n=1 Tax=Syntrophotalea carbinolica (strain DSM 2380 / NBRC 103641 / GraBd1) TaxID=338963 RepID=Q3A0C8_SYNC1|nr:glutamate synthase-related protein [Syntrophotalea carbinolica]ABA90179.1 ferredoxin-dependent glutamate synthase [Syntrophotalea carbinolica DSM 2380]
MNAVGFSGFPSHIDERDACAIIGFFKKHGQPTHGNLQRTIEALIKMGHRAGEVGGEGDGCGVLTDIPRLLWRETLARADYVQELAEAPEFAVAHLLLPRSLAKADMEDLQNRILALFRAHGCRVLLHRPLPVRSEILSASARASEPLVWQLALTVPEPEAGSVLLYELHVALEAELPIQVASLSQRTTAYKVHGAPEMLARYYPDLKRRDFLSAATIGHSRFSTNTLPTVLRAQPFSLLGHNGEINTIERLREEARLLGIVLPAGGSDSQDLNRLLEGLMQGSGLSLFEAMEMVFPPIFSEMQQLPDVQRQLFGFFRRFFPTSAQGPAAVIARSGDQVVCSVDAMGLRPLWFGETEREYFASSEVGVVPQEEILADPKPLAPGEKVGMNIPLGKAVEVLNHQQLRNEVQRNFQRRTSLPSQARMVTSARNLPDRRPAAASVFARSRNLLRDNLLSACAWKTSDLRSLKEMASAGRDPIASLGYDGPLAALANTRQNLADYLKEQVAVVTNPAIDREREAEHFSTRVFLGGCPTLRGRRRKAVEMMLPLLLGGRRLGPVNHDDAIAADHGTTTLERLLGHFSGGRHRFRRLSCALRRQETVPEALARLGGEASVAVAQGSVLLLIDDSQSFSPGYGFLDPLLLLAWLQSHLIDQLDEHGECLRRSCSLVLRSGALRNLHDLICALGMGADAVCPYLMWELADDYQDGVGRLLDVLGKGLEKVMSTMGIHEIGGYGRHFAGIGLAPELADILGLANFCGSAQGGLTLARLGSDGWERSSVARSRRRQPVAELFRLYPRIWKTVAAVAKMEENYDELSRLIRRYMEEHPLAIRHLLDFSIPSELTVDPRDVDASVGGHDLPIIISAMSFGSQGETAFRIYAEAAKRLNIVCMNGEGGEIPDMLGKYRGNRGQQLASGRFGVHMDLLNSADILEIKVGQGAKPGEGGHLPGFKVTGKIAEARNAAPGVTLISPSNNHDIYSIEDLAQIIEELRTANPRARISIKVPAVAGIGTIAMGIAKAGADIITISGYDGGTGAARQHAIKFVGMPAEIGVREAHRALAESGLRHKVEIWADGGMHSGRDVVKMILLGANRVGFGTLPMVVIGCTACRSCHLGTCHVGIATQIETVEEAQAKGLKRFVPRVLENGIIYETTFFRALGEEIRNLTARLGFRRTQDMVGKADLLVQQRGHEHLDLSDLLAPVPLADMPRSAADVRIIRKPLNYLTSLISSLVTEALDGPESRIRYEDQSASSSDRAIGTYLAGAMARDRAEGRPGADKQVLLHFRRNAIPGNGLAAFNISRINLRIEGSAQDGVGKGARGGKIVVLKGENRQGQRVGGAVGKGLAYGAQGGLFLIQGDADSRACVRLSGAEVVIGGRLRQPLDDEAGNLAGRANIKGFAFEYMTAGHVVVLGDPGPWLCSGMTGGSVYCLLDEPMGMTHAALKRRLARAAQVDLYDLDDTDVEAVERLLGAYHRELLYSHQAQEAAWVEQLKDKCRTRFVRIAPVGAVDAPPVMTE